MKNSKFKIRIVSTVVMILFMLNPTANAQSWPQEGATWRYCLRNWAGLPAAFRDFGVTQDTIIAGKTWHMIQQTADQHGPVIVPPDHPTTLFTRYENDTVFRWVNDQDYLFFTYNLEVGDVFTTFRSAGFTGLWNDSACTSRLPLEVIDFEMVQYGDLNLKQWTLRDTLFHDLYETAGPEDVIYVLTERIGVLNSYPLINTQEPPGQAPGECNLPSDWGTAGIGTYSDNETEIVLGECKGVGISAPDEISEDELLFIPLSKDIFLIKPGKTNTHQNMQLRCYDSFGRQQHSQKFYKGQQQTTLDVSSWSAGMYIAVMYCDGGACGKVKFVVR
ncbi:MAG: T9SS type A sorting domain-containing protein [Bacteroidales bacterium]|nr:T9SS type A sorting domain-containing protein [Bacteroidales bacterium]